ncbi:putative quinol monooxygenase [Kitasatospora phosalacinea]|uniref:putative quinol monooxygenase n=1 Tax=Kitasatospora phosalacinea TaxID=2065 RepID=UPI003657139C
MPPGPPLGGGGRRARPPPPPPPRAEEGNVFFEWSRSVDDPHQYVLLEAFRDGEAGGRHVESEHFRTAMAWMPDFISRTPEIVNVEVPGTGWSAMAELSPRG